MYQKSFVQDKWAILGLKMAHPHNSGLALRIFLKFCWMKGANRYMKILLAVFREKKIICDNLIFLAMRPFFLFDWPWSNWARPLLIGSLNSQDMISFMIATGFLNNQDMTTLLKRWGCLCGGQNSWFCKASLRIC